MRPRRAERNQDVAQQRNRAPTEPAKVEYSRGSWVWPALLAVAACLVYVNSFDKAFVFDDIPAIVENPLLRNLASGRWLTDTAPNTTVSGRPVAQWTLALNYGLGGAHVWGYHAVNLSIHIGCSVLLFLLICELAHRTDWGRAHGRAAGRLAFAAALWWTVHPLGTQAVTYIVQRTESLASLCYLATLYAALRGTGRRHARAWQTAAVAACWLGMATKEIMVTAPLAVVLQDWIFVADGWKTMRRRLAFYGALASAWVLLPGLLAAGTQNDTNMQSGLSPIEYLRIQVEVIRRYLVLAIAPARQVFDYYIWPVPPYTAGWFVTAAGLTAIGISGVVAALRRRWYGFPVLVFFLLLAPTSSLLPLFDQAWEYRMYLPLAAVLALTAGAVAAGMTSALRKLDIRRPGYAWIAVGVAFAAVCCWHGSLAVRRNRVYRSEETLWRDTLAHRPTNARAHMNLAKALLKEGREAEALMHFERGLQVGYRPGIQGPAHHNLANLYFDRGELDKARFHYTRTLELDPENTPARVNRALVFMRLKRYAEAAEDQRAALAVIRNDPVLHVQHAYALVALGKKREAAAQVAFARRLGYSPPQDLIDRLR